jgi:hypothetical protein
VKARPAQERPSFGAGVRTAVLRTDRKFLQGAARNLGAWTTNGTFAEALAFLTGYDAARAGSYLPGFQRWLASRPGAPHGDSLAELVRHEALARQRAASDHGDTAAVETLFDLLDTYLGIREGDRSA